MDVLRQTINMILVDFQTHCFYCKWKKDTFISSGFLTVSFHQRLKLCSATSQSSLGLCWLVSVGICSGMSDKEKQPSDKRHMPPDIFQTAQSSRILVFWVVQAKSPAHKKEKKNKFKVLVIKTQICIRQHVIRDEHAYMGFFHYY